MVYVYVPAFGACFFTNFGRRSVSSIRQYIGHVFWAKFYWKKNTKFGQDWVDLFVCFVLFKFVCLFACFWKMLYWWLSNCRKNWIQRKSNFEVWQAHPHTVLAKVPPPGPPSHPLPFPSPQHNKTNTLKGVTTRGSVSIAGAFSTIPVNRELLS